MGGGGNGCDSSQVLLVLPETREPSVLQQVLNEKITMINFPIVTPCIVNSIKKDSPNIYLSSVSHTGCIF